MTRPVTLIGLSSDLLKVATVCTAMAALLALVFVSACDKKSPTGPSTSTPTRIITVGGVLAFGNIEVGSFFDLNMLISNSGTEALTVTGMTGPTGYVSSWTAGTIQPGATQTARVRFSPTEARSYSGTVTVNGNHTSGINTLAVNGFGVRTGPLWTMSGFGNTVFDMPAYVTRVRIKGTWNRASNSNFIVHIGGRGVINEILRDVINYEGVHLTNGGGITEIVSSGNITWSFEEVR